MPGGYMTKKNKKSIDSDTVEKKGRDGFIVLIIVLVVILAAVAGMFAFQKIAGADGKGPGGKNTAVEEEAVFAINITPSVTGPISDYFDINGEVVSASTVETYPDTQGILARLYVRLGDRVNAGQVIAEIDPSRPGLTYSLSPVKARVSGTITKLPVDIGDAVSPQLSIATIGDLSRLQVVAAIPERFISQIRVGMDARVSLEAWPGESIPLKVSQVNPVVDPASRTMEVKMDIPRNQQRAKAGMYAEVRLTTDQKDSVVKIPADTIIRRMGETFVYVVENDRAVKKIIQPGITLDGVVEVINGLDSGEKVVYQGQTLLEDGVKVRVVREVDVINGGGK